MCPVARGVSGDGPLRASGEETAKRGDGEVDGRCERVQPLAAQDEETRAGRAMRFSRLPPGPKFTGQTRALGGLRDTR